MTAREDLAAVLLNGGTATNALATGLLDAYRAEVLNEAADMVAGAFHGEPFLNYPPDFADFLRQKAGEQSAAPDFFQAGHSYMHRDDTTFRCVAVIDGLKAGTRLAVGWATDLAGITYLTHRNIDHWRHEYDGCAEPTTGGAA